jgi:predicted alpha/beta superfamily hydrolase
VFPSYTPLLLALFHASQGGAAPGTTPKAKVTLVVTGVPAETPAAATLTIGASLNDWNPEAPGYAFTPAPDGTRTLTLELREGTSFEYKLTRGGWSSVERNADGSEKQNRTLDVTGDARVELRVERWLDSPGAKAEAPSTLTGTVERLAGVHSPQLRNKRDVLVYLPPSYRTSDKRYPVLYMLDGQNVFDVRTSTVAQEWRADEAAEALAAQGLEVIIVAIAHGGSARAAEYVAFGTPANGYKPKGEAHATFVAKTVKVLIDKRYRTLPDAAHTGIAGSSFGGVASLYTALRYPEVFGFVGSFSPALWVADQSLFRYAHEHPAPRTLRAYLDMGDREGIGRAEKLYAIELTEEMADLLHHQGAEVRFVRAENAWHNEDAWAQRFPAVLEWFVSGSR